MMEAWRVHRFLDVQTFFGCGKKDVGDRGDDARSARRSQHIAQLAIVENDGGRHRTQRPFARSDGVGRPLNEAIEIGHAHLCGEIIHFVVKQKSQ